MARFMSVIVTALSAVCCPLL